MGRQMNHYPKSSELLREQDAAEILNLKVTTLRRWRWAGYGPRFIKLGAAVRYDVSDLDTYIARSRRSSTSDTGNAA